MGASLIGGMVFGAVGFVALAYAKRQASFKLAAIGLALMVYPYFVYDALAVFVIGALLTAALFVVRD